MFVGWIRKNSLEKDLEDLSAKVLLDKLSILKAMEDDESLCYGIYDGTKLSGILTAINLEKTLLINNFVYLSNVNKTIRERIISLFFKNITTNKTILFLAKTDEIDIFKSFDFLEFGKFLKATYKGGAVFNFTNAMSKYISNENYLPIIKQVDFLAFNEDRVDFITKNAKQSSLLLSTKFGYQHSYALDKAIIKISPWIMDIEAFDDAEKLLRGVIYHRGLKILITFIPADVPDIVELYESYNFKFESGYKLLYKNEKPNINIEMIYGF
ncbi:MAG: hypothetical protein PHF17_07050 [Arcobacteraceae bacterium]|nr:hypothetical protein [Arcobacteraceae bacterium]